MSSVAAEKGIRISPGGLRVTCDMGRSSQLDVKAVLALGSAFPNKVPHHFVTSSWSPHVCSGGSVCPFCS